MSNEDKPSSKSSPEQTQSSLWTTWTFLALSVWKKLSKRTQPAVMIVVVMIYLCVMSSQLVDHSKQRRSAARGQAKIIPVC
jgi:hypothetical protein